MTRRRESANKLRSLFLPLYSPQLAPIESCLDLRSNAGHAVNR